MENNNINYKKLQKKLKKHLPVYQYTESHNYRYPEFAEAVDFQKLNNHWTWKEVDVSKDKQDMLVEMTESEKFAIEFSLKLFLKYEVIIGGDWWADVFFKMFKRPEFQRKAIFNSDQELNIHAPFYKELFVTLGLNTEDFYSSYLQDPELLQRTKFVGELLNHPLDLIKLSTFSFLEGAVLYSTFGFFKHFQMNGKNKVANVVRGTDFSVLDENNHAIDATNAFKIVVREGFEAGILNETNFSEVKSLIYQLAQVLFEHECLIIEKTYSKGPIEGITISQAKNFMLLRLNEVLMLLDLEPIFKVSDKTIYNWFKATTDLYASNDTFQGKSREYVAGFNESLFRYMPPNELFAITNSSGEEQ